MCGAGLRGLNHTLHNVSFDFSCVILWNEDTFNQYVGGFKSLESMKQNGLPWQLVINKPGV
jgi:hypothetical protein